MYISHVEFIIKLHTNLYMRKKQVPTFPTFQSSVQFEVLVVAAVIMFVADEVSSDSS